MMVQVQELGSANARAHEVGVGCSIRDVRVYAQNEGAQCVFVVG